MFTVELDAEAEDAVSKGLAQAINDDKVDGSIIVRRVHEGSVDEIGSAKSGEAITFESDRFSIYALGSKAKSTSNAVGNLDDSSDESKDKEDSKDGQSQGSDQTTANRTQTTGVTTGSQAAGSSTKLADTSDSESPVIVLPILGLVVCGLGVAGRRRSTART